MDDYDQMRPQKRRKGGIGGKLVMVAIVVIIIIAIGFYYYFSGGPISISGPTSVTVNSNGAVFSIAGKSYVATLAGYNNDTKTAYLYVSEVPVFLGPVLNVTLHQNNTVKINYNTAYAVMQMTLISGSRNSEEVQIAPLAASLAVQPDYQYIGHPTVPVSNLKITVTTTAPTTTTVASGSGSSSTTTVAAGTTSSSTTTAATTTIQAANGTQIAINTALKSDENYALMLNFTALYNATSGCTANQYSNSYFELHASLPTGPLDYYNMSYETPYGMVQKTVSKGGGNYNVEFLPQVDDPQFNSTVALTIALTVKPSGTTTIAVVNSDTYGGIFAGATYSDLASEYTATKSVGNACAALVG